MGEKNKNVILRAVKIYRGLLNRIFCVVANQKRKERNILIVIIKAAHACDA